MRNTARSWCGRWGATTLLTALAGLVACSGAIDHANMAGSPAAAPGSPPESRAGAPSSTSGGTPTGSTPAPGDVKGQFAPAPTGMRRLTRAQYDNAVADLLGAGMRTTADLDPDERNGHAFETIAAYTVTTSPQGVQEYGLAAFELAAQALAAPRRAMFVGCEPRAADDPCVGSFVKGLARRAWRRTPEPAELEALAKVVKVTTGEQGSVWTGLEYAIAAVLQAPSFVYVPEVGELDPEDRGRVRYTSVEMASRLAFALWNAPPDVELLDAGERGELVATGSIAQQVDRMLKSPRARAGVASFFAQHLGYEKLEGHGKSKEAFPTWTPALMTSMRAELDALTAALLDGGSTLELLDTREARVDKPLAALYELPAPTGNGLARAQHREDRPRAGILTSAGMLAMHSGNRLTSPTFRGLVVRERLLCQQTPVPPDDVNTDLDAGGKARTTRERVEQHRTNPTCAACHAFMDPIGLAFENFDAVGRYRARENDQPIDASGDLDGRKFNGPRELAAVLRTDARIVSCFVREVYRYATGHEELPGERPTLEALTTKFMSNGHGFRALLVDLATSAGFRYAAKP